MSLQNGIIASSLALQKWLYASWEDIQDYKTNSILVRKGELSFDGRKMILCIEARKDFVVNVKTETLLKLRNFLDLIDEQPITLYFEDNGWIWIKEAIL